MKEYYRVFRAASIKELMEDVNNQKRKGQGWEAVGSVVVDLGQYGSAYMQAVQRKYVRNPPGRPKENKV